MQDWPRGIAFMRAIDERAAEEVVPFRWGRALINRRLNRVHDLNFLIVDRLDGAGEHRLGAGGDPKQGGSGPAPPRLNVDDPPAADRLAADFEALGYTPERFVIMAHRRSPDGVVDTGSVRQVDWDVIRPAREREIASQPWGRDPAVVQQLLAKHELTAKGTRTRYLGGLIAAGGY